MLNVPKATFPAQDSQQRSSNGRNKVVLKPGHSLMDWIRLGKSKPDLAGTRGKILTVTSEELAKHNKPKDAWMAIRGRVYNVTPYMDFHPGGVMELMRGVGMDATKLFMEVHKWVNAESMLEKCYVGKMEAPVAPSTGSLANQEDIKVIPELETETEAMQSNLFNENEIITRWTESDLDLEIIAYGKKRLQEEDVVIDKFNNRYEIHIFCERPSKKSWLIHFEPKYKLSEKNIKISADRMQEEIYKLTLNFKKSLPGKWNSIGKFLNANLSFDTRPDWELRERHCLIENMENITHDTKLLCIRFPEGCRMRIPVGYHIYLRSSIDGMTVSKPYTVVPQSLLPQSNEKNQIGTTCYLMIKIYDNGFTTCLRSLKIGESIIASNYEGSFDIEKLKNVANLVMIAAGTGFTPMASLIHYCIHNLYDTKMKLMFFNKTEKDVLWARDLCIVEENSPNLKVMNVLSQPSDNWNGPTGRIRKELLENWLPDSLSSSLICVCGPSLFTDKAYTLLKDDFHFPEEKIHLFVS